jgi:hypothetical protein
MNKAIEVATPDIAVVPSGDPAMEKLPGEEIVRP